tara:strand:- start:2506 stop:4059 length:1554 start_codon:yes stop_codon:yes gene_type:complete
VDIVENKALLLRLRNPALVLDRIAKSKLYSEPNAKGISEVLVHWGIKESQELTQIGVKNVPSPIKTNYEWSGKFKPFDHQIETSSFLTLHKKACCFNEQGTGKTASVIWAADYLMNLGLVNRVLVICPLSIMQSAWMEDLFSCAMHRTAAVCHGRRNKRSEIVKSKAEFVIINYDGVEIVKDEIKNGGFNLIVVDEANAYKNVSTRRWKILKSLVTDSTRLWMLTGTPASQSPVDAYGLAKLVNPTSIPRFLGRWREMVMRKVTQFKYIPRIEAKGLVYKALQPAIRYTKEECLDLPAITYVTRDVALTAQQNKYYKLMKQRLIVSAAGEDITMVNAAAAMNKLLQLSGGTVYSDEGEIITFDASPRIKVLDEIIEESSHKLIIFVPYRHAILTVSEHLKKSGITCEIINGAVSAFKRADIFKKFQEKDDPKVLVIQPQAASHGVTLHRADTVVYWSPVMSVETYLQCNARAHRAGQKNPVTVIHLQGSEVERKVYKMLADKINIHSNIVNLYKDML